VKEWGAAVVALGIIAVVIVFGLALGRVPPGSVVAIVAAAFGVIGTIVGAYFGMQAGAKAGSNAAGEASRATEQALANSRQAYQEGTTMAREALLVVGMTLGRLSDGRRVGGPDIIDASLSPETETVQDVDQED